MTDHPDTLASAAREYIQAIEALGLDVEWGERVELAEVNLCAALAAHDQQDPWADTFEVVQDGEYFEVHRTSTAAHRVVSQESVHGTRDAAVARLAELRGVDVSDTPEPPTCGFWLCDLPAGHGGDHVADLNDAPEGGQPDTDDELLARADRAQKVTPAGPITLIADLASALRRQRALASEWETSARTYERITSRLERELAKARERADDWEKIAADYRRGTVTVTDGMLDDWIAALRSGNAIVFGPPQANGLADRLAEARSHGEVLAHTTTEYQPPIAPDIGPTSLVHAYVKAESGTEVLVLRATADQEETDDG